MKRHPQWTSRLEAVFNKYADMDFNWTGAHCVTFTADCIEAVVQHDPMAEWRAKAKKVKTKRGALGLLKKYCGGGVMEAAEKNAELMGLREIQPGYAKRGDPVVVMNDENELVFGVVDLTGRQVAGMGPDNGLCYVPVGWIMRAWSLP